MSGLNSCKCWVMLQGFVTCAYGAHVIGRVLICYGICDALASVRKAKEHNVFWKSNNLFLIQPSFLFCKEIVPCCWNYKSTDALAKHSFGYVIKLVGRIPVFILGAAINIIVIIVMLSWQPTLANQPGTVVCLTLFTQEICQDKILKGIVSWDFWGLQMATACFFQFRCWWSKQSPERWHSEYFIKCNLH